MEYTIIVNGRSYDLPKKTMSVMGKLDEVLKIDTMPNLSARKKFEKLHCFVNDILGEETAGEILGSENLEEIDMSELSLTVLKINDAYNQPISDYRTEKMREELSSIPEEKIVPLMKSIQTMANMRDLAR